MCINLNQEREFGMTDVTQECKSCQSQIPLEALKCSKCGEWREDIKSDKTLCYLWSFISFLPIVALFYGRAQGWWAPPPVTMEFMGIRMPAMQLYTFDWSTFFASPSGWLVLLVLGISAGLTIKYYISASKKMNNWIWV